MAYLNTNHAFGKVKLRIAEYQVEAVERCWTTGTRRSGGQMDRHHFQVRCAEGKFDLYQDLQHNTWHIAR